MMVVNCESFRACDDGAAKIRSVGYGRIKARSAGETLAYQEEEGTTNGKP